MIHCAGSRVHTDAGLTLTWPAFAGPTLAWPTLAWPTFACPTLPRLSHARLTLAMRSVVVTHTITRVVVTHTTARTARTRPVPSRTHRRHPQHAQSLLSSPPTHRRGAAGVHVPHSAATCGRRVRTPDRAAPAAPARHVRSCRSGAPCRHATASPATAELRRYSCGMSAAQAAALRPNTVASRSPLQLQRLSPDTIPKPPSPKPPSPSLDSGAGAGAGAGNAPKPPSPRPQQSLLVLAAWPP
mmetsp:Transcript_22960/g.52058  ORF Transcript_22960/g.52058 Transcript_22960/m.52058 type:complete len:242 (+) Transcript_22960:37-762(+)